MRCLFVGLLCLFCFLSSVAVVHPQSGISSLTKLYEVDGDGDISDKTYGFTIRNGYPSGSLEYSFFKRDGIPVDHHHL